MDASHMPNAIDVDRRIPLDEASENTCPICMDPISNPTTTECQHQFCSDCLATWLQGHNTCPYCRTTLSDVPHTAIELLRGYYGIDASQPEPYRAAMSRFERFLQFRPPTVTSQQRLLAASHMIFDTYAYTISDNARTIRQSLRSEVTEVALTYGIAPSDVAVEDMSIQQLNSMKEELTGIRACRVYTEIVLYKLWLIHKGTTEIMAGQEAARNLAYLRDLDRERLEYMEKLRRQAHPTEL